MRAARSTATSSSQGAIRGMIEALGDPYSSYLTSQEYRESLQSISGEFEGIGAEIATEAPDGTQGCATLSAACHLVIVAALEGSPAQDAGLRSGDLVLATDGVPLDGLTWTRRVIAIRGPKGSVVDADRATRRRRRRSRSRSRRDVIERRRSSAATTTTAPSATSG